MTWLCARRASALLALSRMLDEERGQGLTEYALILALIALIAVLAVGFYGSQVTSLLTTVAASV